MKKQRQQRFEAYNHRVLWRIGLRILDSAISSEDGPVQLQYSLGAILLLFFAFEGYMNWLGDRISPEVWEYEKDFFSRGPYQGPLGKYCFLAKILGLPRPDTSRGRFQTAKAVLNLRDMAVHPKTEAGKRQVKYAEGHFAPQYMSKLSQRVSLKKATCAKEHLGILAESLHERARVAYPEEIHEKQAFGSMLGVDITDA